MTVSIKMEKLELIADFSAREFAMIYGNMKTKLQE